MAIVDKITGEKIELLRGEVDFYLLRGILPVARRWPQKTSPPYTELQAEAQMVFGALKKALKFIKGKVLEDWKKNAVGMTGSWCDLFLDKGMYYWKHTREMPPVLLDYGVSHLSPRLTAAMLLAKIDEKYGVSEVKEIKNTGFIDPCDLIRHQEQVHFWIETAPGISIVAPYIEYIFDKAFELTYWLDLQVGFIDTPLQVALTNCDINKPVNVPYFYHGMPKVCKKPPKPKGVCQVKLKDGTYICLTFGSKEETPEGAVLIGVLIFVEGIPNCVVRGFEYGPTTAYEYFIQEEGSFSAGNFYMHIIKE